MHAKKKNKIDFCSSKTAQKSKKKKKRKMFNNFLSLKFIITLHKLNI